MEAIEPAKPARVATQYSLIVACLAASFAVTRELRHFVPKGLGSLGLIAIWAPVYILSARRERRDTDPASRYRERGDESKLLEVIWAAAWFAGIAAFVAGLVTFAATPWPLAARAAALMLSVLMAVAGTLVEALWPGRSTTPAPRVGRRMGRAYGTDARNSHGGSS